jgi:hypothetical protein
MAGYSLRSMPGPAFSLPAPTTPFRDEALAADIATGSVMGRGLRSGLAGGSAARAAYLAQLNEAMGRDEAARAGFAEAQADAERAAMLAPETSRLSDIGKTGGVGDYVRAKLGEGFGSTLPVLAGAAVGGVPGAMAMALPAEAGETVLSLRNDPVAMARTTPGSRLGISTARGGVNAALESVVPASIFRGGVKDILKAPIAGTAKRVGRGMVTEGLTEGAQEYTGILAEGYANPSRDRSGDTERLVEAGAAGAVAGGGFGLAGAARDATVGGLSAGLDAAQKGAKKAPDVTKDALDSAKDLTDSVKSRASESPFTAVLRNPDLATIAGRNSVPPEVAEQGLDAVSDYLQQQDGDVRLAIQRQMQALVDDESKPAWRRARAQEFLDNIDNPESWDAASQAIVGQARAEQVRDAVATFGARLGAKVHKVAKDKLGSKFNLQLDARDEVIKGRMASFLEPEVAADEDTVTKLYSFMKSYFDKDNGYDGALPTEVLDMFPNERVAERALESLHALFVRTGVADRDQNYAARMDVKDAMRRRKAVRDELLDHLDVQWGDVPVSALNSIAAKLEQAVNSGELSKHNADLKELFGPNTERALARLRPLLEDKSLQSRIMAEADKEDDVDGFGELTAEDFGSDAPDGAFNEKLEEGGPRREFVSSGRDKADRPTFWLLGHQDEAVRGQVQERYDNAKKKARLQGKVVRELTPLEYAQQADLPLTEVAKQLGLEKNYGGKMPPKALLKNLLKARPERMLMTEAADINEDTVEFTEKDVESLVAHGNKTKIINRPKKPGAQAPDKKDLHREHKTGWELLNDEDRHGRFYVTVKAREVVDRETGNIEREPGKLKAGPVPISAQQLISMMFKKKGDSAFDEKTDALTGDAQLRSMFAAGYSSLVSSGFIEPGILVKSGTNEDGTPRFKRMNPAAFPIFRRPDGKGGYTETFLGVAGKEEAARVSATAKELKEAGRTAKTPELPTGEEREKEVKRERDQRTNASVMGMGGGTPQKQGAYTETKLTAPIYEYIDRDNNGNIFGSRKQAAAYAKATDLVVKRNKQWVVRRQHGWDETTTTVQPTETEEFATSKKAEEPRKFDEFGNELVPRDKNSPDQDVAQWTRELAQARTELAAAKTFPRRNEVGERVQRLEKKLKEAKKRAEMPAPGSTTRRSSEPYKGPDAEAITRSAERAEEVEVPFGPNPLPASVPTNPEMAERLQKARELTARVDGLFALAQAREFALWPVLTAEIGIKLDNAVANGNFALVERQIQNIEEMFSTKFNLQGAQDIPGAMPFTVRRAIRDGANAHEVAELLLKDKVDVLTASQRRFLQWVLKTEIGKKVNVEFVDLGEKTHGRFARSGGPNPERNIMINPRDRSVTPHTFVHELAHAVFSHAFRNPTPAQRPLVEYFEKLYEVAKSKKDQWWAAKSTPYGLHNPHEFMAEFLGNPKFREALSTIDLGVDEAPLAAAYSKAFAQSKAKQLAATKKIHDIPTARAEVMAMLDDHLAQTGKVVESRGGVGIFSVALREIANAPLAEGRGYNYNRQRAGTKPLNTQKEVREYVEKVLGPKVKVAFKDTLPQGASGMWHENAGKEFITLATTALDPMSIAHHEAMHGFFRRLVKAKESQVGRTLLNAASSAPVRRQLERLLANEPAALKQLDDPEERLAYMYQFWAANDPTKRLTIGPETRTVFQKISDFIRKTLHILTEDQKAALILEAFHDGKLADVSAVGRVLASSNNVANTLEKVREGLKPAVIRVKELVMTSEGMLMESENPHLRNIARLFNSQTGAMTGFFPAYSQRAAKYLNKFEAATRDATRKDLDVALEALQREDGVPPKDPVAAKVYSGIREVLDEMLPYLRDAGLNVGFVKNYFPRVWDVQEIMARSDEFQKRLIDLHSSELQGLMRAAKIPGTLEDFTKSLVASITSNAGALDHGLKASEAQPSYSPFMQAMNARELTFLKSEEFADFMQKDLVSVVSSYAIQGVKRAEWARRFGDRGEVLDALVEKAEERETKSGKSQEQVDEIMRPARRAILAMSGTLGYDISPALRKASGVAMIYQNLRLLPLSLFSQVIDPLGIVIRGGSLKDAGTAFLRGMREIMTGRSNDEQQRIAEMLGTVDASSFMESLGNMYSSVYMHGWQKKVNDAIFKYNGMEAWNRGIRTSATQAAIGFIKRHVEAPNEHSKRYLLELGLRAKDVTITDGALDLADPKIQQAVMRWVDGAILRPNAAQRPAWASDPHYAVFFHMKQFMYSFQKVIIQRTFDELKAGNVAPIATLAFGYVPIMIAADMAKGVLTGFGDEPDWKKGWGPSDYIVNGVQRAGLLGVGQMAVDTLAYGPAALGGPAVEQAAGAVMDPIGRTALRALPAQGMWTGRSASKSEGEDE